MAIVPVRMQSDRTSDADHISNCKQYTYTNRKEQLGLGNVCHGPKRNDTDDAHAAYSKTTLARPAVDLQQGANDNQDPFLGARQNVRPVHEKERDGDTGRH